MVHDDDDDDDDYDDDDDDDYNADVTNDIINFSAVDRTS